MSGWRPALRIAWRDALRHRGRSILVLVMISLPVLAVGAAAVILKTAEVSGVEGVERGMNTVVQAALFEEVTVGLGGGGKAAGNRYACTGEVADHLAQGCILAPYMLHIVDAELIEGNDVLYQGELSTVRGRAGAAPPLPGFASRK